MLPELGEELHKGEVHKRIAIAKKNHPQCVVVYFVKHKQAPASLPRPTTPLMLFKRDLRIEEVMYALYEQVQQKGLAFYVLKSEPNNRVRFVMVKAGETIGKVFEEYAKDDYLALIYHNTAIGGRKVTPLERRIIRFAVLIAFIWIALYAVPRITGYFDPSAPSPSPPEDFEES